MALLPVASALQQILAGIEAPGEEMVSVFEADGRVLSRDLAAKFTQPPFAASAMDGYAVFGADAAPVGAHWTVVGESAAGRGFPAPSALAKRCVFSRARRCRRAAARS